MTILHEIGHCVLDHTRNNEQEECEAAFFAKFAIAPPVLVEKIGAVSPMDIYNQFDITYEAALYAYEYYLKWKRKHELTGCFTSYEQELIDLYGKNA